MQQRPFQPFRILTSDGATCDVRHPGMVLVTEREIIIAVPKPGERFARHAVHFCYLKSQTSTKLKVKVRPYAV